MGCANAYIPPPINQSTNPINTQETPSQEISQNLTKSFKKDKSVDSSTSEINQNTFQSVNLNEPDQTVSDNLIPTNSVSKLQQTIPRFENTIGVHGAPKPIQNKTKNDSSLDNNQYYQKIFDKFGKKSKTLIYIKNGYPSSSSKVDKENLDNTKSREGILSFERENNTDTEEGVSKRYYKYLKKKNHVDDANNRRSDAEKFYCTTGISQNLRKKDNFGIRIRKSREQSLKKVNLPNNSIYNKNDKSVSEIKIKHQNPLRSIRNHSLNNDNFTESRELAKIDKYKYYNKGRSIVINSPLRKGSENSINTKILIKEKARAISHTSSKLKADNAPPEPIFNKQSNGIDLNTLFIKKNNFPNTILPKLSHKIVKLLKSAKIQNKAATLKIFDKPVSVSQDCADHDKSCDSDDYKFSQIIKNRQFSQQEIPNDMHISDLATFDNKNLRLNHDYQDKYKNSINSKQFSNSNYRYPSLKTFSSKEKFVNYDVRKNQLFDMINTRLGMVGGSACIKTNNTNNNTNSTNNNDCVTKILKQVKITKSDYKLSLLDKKSNCSIDYKKGQDYYQSTKNSDFQRNKSRKSHEIITKNLNRSEFDHKGTRNEKLKLKGQQNFETLEHQHQPHRIMKMMHQQKHINTNQSINFNININKVIKSRALWTKRQNYVEYLGLQIEHLIKHVD